MFGFNHRGVRRNSSAFCKPSILCSTVKTFRGIFVTLSFLHEIAIVKTLLLKVDPAASVNA